MSHISTRRQLNDGFSMTIVLKAISMEPPQLLATRTENTYLTPFSHSFWATMKQDVDSPSSSPSTGWWTTFYSVLSSFLWKDVRRKIIQIQVMALGHKRGSNTNRCHNPKGIHYSRKCMINKHGTRNTMNFLPHIIWSRVSLRWKNGLASVLDVCPVRKHHGRLFYSIQSSNKNF